MRLSTDFGSVISLERSALARNIKFLKTIIGEAVFSSVVKGNAYGHGIESFVPLAESCGVRHFSVFSAPEAERVLLSRLHDSHVMIMGYVNDSDLDWTIEQGASFYVFDPPRLEAAIEAAARVGRPAHVHLQLETGMRRLGLEKDALDVTVGLIRSNPNAVVVEGICTHLAGAESVANYVRVKAQLDRFAMLCDQLRAAGISFGVRHAASSAGLFMYPEAVLDMVRVGIAQYGFWPSTEVKLHCMLRQQSSDGRTARDPLKRVLTWTSQVMSVKDVGPGDFVGYGTTYQTTRRERIASVPVGYFSGFPRILSNRGHVLIRGARAPVVGTVNMSMMLVDVTHIPRVDRGDEVTIIGSQGRQSVSIASFSDLSDVMNYEALVRLPEEIPRFVRQRNRVNDARSAESRS